MRPLVLGRSYGHHQVNKGKPREPLRAFKEMAEEFGVEPNRLKYLTGFSVRIGIPSPDPITQSTPESGGSNARYYRPSEMRAWWKKFNARLAERTTKE